MKKLCKDKIEGRLREWFSGAKKVAVVGLGSTLRRDDFVGVQIVRTLRPRVLSSSVYLLECEAIPESYIDSIVDFSPSHLLVIDAASLNLKPGSANLLSSNQLAKQTTVSTHALPLRIFCEYLEREVNLKIGLLLIQPKDTDFGEGLSKEVEGTAIYVAGLLSKLLQEVFSQPSTS